MAFEIKFSRADYNEEMRYKYNDAGVRYKKSDPRRNTHTKLVETWWAMHDEENTVYFEGF